MGRIQDELLRTKLENDRLKAALQIAESEGAALRVALCEAVEHVPGPEVAALAKAAETGELGREVLSMISYGNLVINAARAWKAGLKGAGEQLRRAVDEFDGLS